MDARNARSITQRELRNDSAAVLREVEGGRSLIVTRNGTPVAELRPVGRQHFAPRERIAIAAQRAARIDRRRFRDDVDSLADQRVDD
jgi:prevent-host-death family protein